MCLQAAGDFCISPDVFVEQRAPPALQSDILVYYITCESASQNPFSQTLQRGMASLGEMNAQLTTISRISKALFADKVDPHLDHLTKEVYQTSGAMSGLATELECSYFRTKYVEILQSVCHDAL